MTKPKDAAKWLATAANPKDAREHVHTPHVRAGRTYAADGFRMHIVSAAVDIGEESASPIDYAQLIPTRAACTVTVSKAHLEQAIRACKPFARDAAKITRFSVNGSLDVAATSAEWGDCTVTLAAGDVWSVKGKKKGQAVTYAHQGEDVTFALNYQYALDALAGLPDVVELVANGPSKPVLLRGVVDGVLRQAVIMPMQIPARVIPEEQREDWEEVYC